MLKYYRLVGGVQVRHQRVGRESCKERRFLDLCKDTVDPVTGKTTCVPRYVGLVPWERAAQCSPPFLSCT